MGLPARKTDRRYTYRDYKDWPDDERWELIGGVAYNMSPAPSLNHQALLGALHRQIAEALDGGQCTVLLAPVDVFLPGGPSEEEDDVDTVVQPDVLVVCDPSALRHNGVWGPPDWIIEILSPWTQKKDLAEKFDAYQRSGVKEYWIVDPAHRSLVVYGLVTAASGGQHYGDGLVYTAPNQVPCAAVQGLSIDFVRAFRALRG